MVAKILVLSSAAVASAAGVVLHLVKRPRGAKPLALATASRVDDGREVLEVELMVPEAVRSSSAYRAGTPVQLLAEDLEHPCNKMLPLAEPLALQHRKAYQVFFKVHSHNEDQRHRSNSRLKVCSAGQGLQHSLMNELNQASSQDTSKITLEGGVILCVETAVTKHLQAYAQKEPVGNAYLHEVRRGVVFKYTFSRSKQEEKKHEKTERTLKGKDKLAGMGAGMEVESKQDSTDEWSMDASGASFECVGARSSPWDAVKGCHKLNNADIARAVLKWAKKVSPGTDIRELPAVQVVIRPWPGHNTCWLSKDGIDGVATLMSVGTMQRPAIVKEVMGALRENSAEVLPSLPWKELNKLADHAVEAPVVKVKAASITFNRGSITNKTGEYLKIKLEPSFTIGGEVRLDLDPFATGDLRLEMRPYNVSVKVRGDEHAAWQHVAKREFIGKQLQLCKDGSGFILKKMDKA